MFSNNQLLFFIICATMYGKKSSPTQFLTFSSMVSISSLSVSISCLSTTAAFMCSHCSGIWQPLYVCIPQSAPITLQKVFLSGNVTFNSSRFSLCPFVVHIVVMAILMLSSSSHPAKLSFISRLYFLNSSSILSNSSLGTFLIFLRINYIFFQGLERAPIPHILRCMFPVSQRACEVFLIVL